MHAPGSVSLALFHGESAVTQHSWGMCGFMHRRVWNAHNEYVEKLGRKTADLKGLKCRAEHSKPSRSMNGSIQFHTGRFLSGTGLYPLPRESYVPTRGPFPRC